MRKYEYLYKYTTESFKQIAKLKSPNIEIIGEFKKINHGVLCKCLKNNYHPTFTLEAQKIVYRGDGCPYCAGKRVCYEDSLEYNYPHIAMQWDYTKNNNLKPCDVLCHSNKKVSWICNLGHEWSAKISDRVIDNSGCPYCANKKILIGFNDLWSVEPLTAQLLLHKENGYKATRQSDKRFDWVCPKCGNIIKNRTVSNIVNHGLSCNLCSDGFSYPSKFLYEFLNQLNVDFDAEVNFKWCKFLFQNKIKRGVYDFYFKLNDANFLIEVDGILHYKESNLGALKLSEIKFIDSEKDRLAEENGYNIIRLDCRFSEPQYIKETILNSDLSTLFNLSNIDWKLCNVSAMSSRSLEIYELWKSGNYTLESLSNLYKISKQTVKRYIALLSENSLKKGA